MQKPQLTGCHHWRSSVTFFETAVSAPALERIAEAIEEHNRLFRLIHKLPTKEELEALGESPEPGVSWSSDLNSLEIEEADAKRHKTD